MLLYAVISLGIIFVTGPVFAEKIQKDIILATTTSIQNTGLLDVLIDKFQKENGYVVKTIAVGTGQALALGKRGEADILLVHSPKDEQKLVDAEYCTKRVTFMHNDFVVLGPKDDPAKISSIKLVVEAFKNIAKTKSLFVSRGDDSGTHKKEKEIWKKAECSADKDTYIEAGQGMSQTLQIANEKKGYTLSDRSTYISFKKSIDNLVILFEGDSSLINYYSAMPVNPQKFPKVNKEGAEVLFNFLLSDESKKIIQDFGKDKFGEPLFIWEQMR